MSQKIKIGVIGYGNLGKGIEVNIKNHEDFELVGIFTRRSPDSFKTLFADTKVYSMDDILSFKDKIDIIILCGGSHSDLPSQTPELAKYFNTVDSYDKHSNIPEYYDSVNKIAKENNKTSIISMGWDPGLFSLNRLLFQSILPNGKDYTFWGKGVSQGHSQVLRSIDGVKYGIQYTIPIESALNSIREGNTPDLKNEERHKRVCYVVSEDNSLNEIIEKEIKTVPGYFLEYDTEVNFITEEDFLQNHSNMPHGGVVIRSGKTSDSFKHTMEFSLELEHNPEFTSAVLLAYARACYKFSKENKTGAYTIFDIPLGYLSTMSDSDLRKNLL